MSDLVLLMEPGSSGVEHAIARVRRVLAGDGSVALVASGNHETAVTAVGTDEPIGPSVILTTSGSSGTPRAVELPVEALRASAELAETRLGGPGLWLTAIPVTGAGGLNTVVRSLLNGLDPVVWASRCRSCIWAMFCVMVASARLRRVGLSLEEASSDLGASLFQTFRYVTLPQLQSALVAGALLAFALSFDEIVVTTFTSGAGVQTLPQWIFNNLFRPNQGPIVNAVAALLLLAFVGPVWLAERMSGAESRGAGRL